LFSPAQVFGSCVCFPPSFLIKTKKFLFSKFCNFVEFQTEKTFLFLLKKEGGNKHRSQKIVLERNKMT